MAELKPSDAIQNEYIQIKEIQPSRPGALTKHYGVFSKSQSVILATISWYSPWRQYVLKPDSGTVWNIDCLLFINEFLAKLKEEKKDK